MKRSDLDPSPWPRRLALALPVVVAVLTILTYCGGKK